MPVLLQVAAGGAIGAMLRYLIGSHVGRHLGTGFPWGTLAVNVSGSFLMGIAAVFIVRRADLGLTHLSPFLLTGVLGGFTTFSAFSLETFEFAERGRWDLAGTYMALSVLLGIAAFAGAVLIFRDWVGS